jgi:hypothetical protein
MRPSLLLLLALAGCPSADTDGPADTDVDGSQTDTDVSDTDALDTDALDTDALDTDVADTDLPDQDGDGLSDAVEGGSTGRDTDGDGTPDVLDADSDDDCIPDAMEGLGSPTDADGDGSIDAADLDSDGDGVADAVEDTNCTGVIEAGETDPRLVDSDGDGADDLVELAAGTSGADPGDNPDASGLVVIVAPPSSPPVPATLDLKLNSGLNAVDLYLVLDRSASMLDELTDLRDGITATLDALRCAPLGSGAAGECIPDLWAGAGTVGYTAGGASAYENQIDLSPNASFAGLPTTEPAGCCEEPLDFALWASVTGLGGSSAGACGLSSVPARATCVGSPAANAGYETFGYPCFRDGAMPIVVLATDEAPFSGADVNTCLSWGGQPSTEFNHRRARLIGLVGSGAPAEVRLDLEAMAADSRAIDPTNNDAPLVFDAGADASAALASAIRTLASTAETDLTLVLEDDATDALDVLVLIDHLETAQRGTADCISGLTDRDTNADTFADQYVHVPAQAGVCWTLVPATNATVPATGSIQTYRGTARLVADGSITVETVGLVFVVPPVLTF